MAKIRASVIGAGWYAAQNHIPALARRSDVILDGVSRLGQEELSKVKEHFGFAFASEDFQEVLSRRPDVVIVASPHHLHYQHARAAITSGAHVLCEKPMTLDVGEAWDLVALAKGHGRHLLVAHGYNYLPQVDHLTLKIAEGAIGTIEHAAVSFISATRDVFEGQAGLRQWESSLFRPDRSTWQDPGKGGGFAYGQLSHALSLLFLLTGLAPTKIGGSTFGRDGIDFANAASLCLSNSAVAAISGAAAMPQGNRALMRIYLAGSEGVIAAEFDRDFCEIRQVSGEVERLNLSDGDWAYRCDGPVDALVDLARNAGTNLSTSINGAQTVATIAALLQSSRQDGQVQTIRAHL